MTTAIDTNVLSALWKGDEHFSQAAAAILQAAYQRGAMVIPAPVYSELLAGPARTPAFIDAFCKNAGIRVDWNLTEPVWRAAGTAFQAYSRRRERTRESHPRRILADFLIGAYAVHHRCQLLTFDPAIYEDAFPALTIVSA